MAKQIAVDTDSAEIADDSANLERFIAYELRTRSGGSIRRAIEENAELAYYMATMDNNE